MARATRRRMLLGALAALVVLAVVVAWSAIRSGRDDVVAQPVPTTSSPAGDAGDKTTTNTDGTTDSDIAGGVQISGDGAQPAGGLAPSNRLGAPLPEPDVQAQAELPPSGSPIDVWWRRVLPVDGDLLPIDRYAAGHVRIERIGEAGLRLRLTNFEVMGPQPITAVRIILSPGPVLGARRGYWAARGTAYDITTVPTDERDLTVDIDDLRSFPDVDMRSLVLFDADTGVVLGGAALIPSR